MAGPRAEIRQNGQSKRGNLTEWPEQEKKIDRMAGPRKKLDRMAGPREEIRQNGRGASGGGGHYGAVVTTTKVNPTEAAPLEFVVGVEPCPGWGGHDMEGGGGGGGGGRDCVRSRTAGEMVISGQWTKVSHRSTSNTFLTSSTRPVETKRQEAHLSTILS
ncbi:hypothetical protein Btru_017877 [Bulinus truncatus]|nr:hypothetical protein Btru_017877 [Bulinus truncatus]